MAQTCPGSILAVPSHGYSWNTNYPKGAGIAFPNAYARPNGAKGAYGVGTWSDPVTAAVSRDLADRIPKGSKFYIDRIEKADGSFRDIKRYAVYEDDTDLTNAIVIWVGGATATGTRDNITNAKLSAAESFVEGAATLIINPGLTNACPVPSPVKIASDPAVGLPPSGGGSQTIKVTADDATWQPALGQPGEFYWASNQTWGRDNLRNGPDFTQSIEIDPASWPNGSTLRWSWPSFDGQEGVRGYAAIIYGNEDGGRWPAPGGRVPFAPMRIKDAQTITTQYDVAPGGQRPQDWDLLGEVWLSNSPNSGPAIELGVFWHSPTPGDDAANAQYTFEHPTAGTIYVIEDQGGSNTPFIKAIPANQLLAQTFDWLPLIEFYISSGIITGNEYFSGVDFGVEPFRNAGSLTVNKLVQTVR